MTSGQHSVSQQQQQWQLMGPLTTAVAAASLSALGLCFIGARLPNCRTWMGKTALPGVGLLLLGILLGAVAESFEVETALVATLVAVILRSPVLLCWLGQSSADRRCAPVHTAAILVNWLGASLIEWGAPRPRRGLSAGLTGLWSGRNTGYRGPFLVYFVSWLTGLLIAWRAWRKDIKIQAFPAPFTRRMILAFVCGSSWPMGDAACAVGLATVLDGYHSHTSSTDGIVLIVFGLAVTFLLLKLTWESLQSLQSPFCIHVALVYGCAALTQILQSHLLFHDLSWHPPSDALISLESPNASTLALGCVLVMLSLPILLNLLAEQPDTSSGFTPLPGEVSTTGSAAVDSAAFDDSNSTWYAVVTWSGNPRNVSDTRIAHRILQSCSIFLLSLSVVGYVLGMVQPLIMVKIPGSDKKTVQQHTKSNLELISILYNERMPCAAVTILICTVLIPCLKFGATILALAKPRFLSVAVQKAIQTFLSMMSPYQFVDIFLVLLMLAYLNRSMHICKLMPGFSWFLTFCATSVLLAQIVEVEPILLTNAVPGVDDRRKKSLAEHMDVDAAAAIQGLWKSMGKLFIFLGAWVFSWMTLIMMPIPPLMIQARVVGVVVFVQEPTVPELYNGLYMQSLAFTRFVEFALIWIPLAHTTIATLRMLLEIKRLDPKTLGRFTSSCSRIASAKQVWMIEQLLKPWVMGDSAALALSGLFLSIQEPSKNFILLLAQLPNVPIGFWAFLGMGVASCGLRVSPPALCEILPIKEAETAANVAQAEAALAEESTQLLEEARSVLNDRPGALQGSEVPEGEAREAVVRNAPGEKPTELLDEARESLSQESDVPGRNVKNISVEESGRSADGAKEGPSCEPEAQETTHAPPGDSSASKEASLSMPAQASTETKASGAPVLTSSLLTTAIQQRVPWNAVAVWILWSTLLWQFGPEKPLTIHSLSELNDALHHILPDLNSELHSALPSTLGSCGKLKNSRGKEAATDTADQGAANFGLNCTDKQAVSVIELPGLLPSDHYKCRILWVEGLNTLTFREIALFPEEHARSAVLPLADGDNRLPRQTWVLRVSGHFAGLQVWASVEQATDRSDGYICCTNPYHFMFQISAECAVDREGFDGEFDVQALHMDPISVNLFVGGYFGPGSHAMLKVDLGRYTDTIASDIRGRVGQFLSRLSGDAPKNQSEAPANPMPFKIVDVLNTIMRYNGWHECSGNSV